MSPQPAPDAVIEPFWKVQSVFDPDGTGKDFAYTIGLCERGLPELHLWGRPSLGEDPGHDWMLSSNDRCWMLNELARRLVAGSLTVGSEVTEEYDDGLVTVTFRVDPPGDREELEAYGVPPGVDVLPVRWALHRAPEGPLTPLTPEAESRARKLFADITRGLDPGRPAPDGWQVPTRPSFEVDQRFGPLTPVVLARAAQLWQADDRTLQELLLAAVSANAGWKLSYATVTAIAAARPVGRRRHLEALHGAVHDLLALLTDQPVSRRRWRGVVAGFAQEQWKASDPQGRRNLRLNLADLLHDLTMACLLVEAVADVASPSLLLQARGPWLSGLRREPVLSDAAWRAAPEVLGVVGDLLAPLDTERLCIVARLHVFAASGRIIGAAGYPELCARLQSWALTSAASCPWQPVLSGLPGWRPLLRSVPGAVLGRVPELESWATCLASALTHRGRLSAEDVRTFSLPYEQDLPQLEAVLNAPV